MQDDDWKNSRLRSLGSVPQGGSTNDRERISNFFSFILAPSVYTLFRGPGKQELMLVYMPFLCLSEAPRDSLPVQIHFFLFFFYLTCVTA